MKPRATLLFSLVGLYLLAASHPALACAACYGDTSGSKMGNAATWGIGIMVIIVLGVLGSLIAFGFHLAYRAKHPLPDYQDLLSENEAQPNPGTST